MNPIVVAMRRPGTVMVGVVAAATVATLVVPPTVFAIVQGDASIRSASLDPFDPASPHDHPEGAEEFSGSDGTTSASAGNGSSHVPATSASQGEECGMYEPSTRPVTGKS
jgi:hypothetical protein